jgi:hypothetical protein
LSSFGSLQELSAEVVFEPVDLDGLRGLVKSEDGGCVGMHV